jgi:hypothetical protein
MLPSGLLRPQALWSGNRVLVAGIGRFANKIDDPGRHNRARCSRAIASEPPKTCGAPRTAGAMDVLHPRDIP